MFRYDYFMLGLLLLSVLIVIMVNYSFELKLWFNSKFLKSPDGTSMFKTTKVRKGDIFVYQVWYSLDKGKKWKKAEICRDKEDAEKIINMYIENNSVVYEYDPSKMLNEGKKEYENDKA